MHAVADFLRDYPPFKDCLPELLDAVVAATEIEFYPQGAMVLRAGHGSSEHAYVVRTGNAELLDGARLVDVLEPGDLFGIPSMLTDLPPGLDVRAAEDLLVYRIPAPAIVPLFADRAGLRFLGATVRDRSTSRITQLALLQLKSPALAEIVRQPALVEGHTTIREVVRLMHELDASSAVIPTEDGWGILTDNDLRNRVLARECKLTHPVSSVMTPKALFVREDLTAEDAVLVMLTHSIRHLLVVDLSGELIGVLEEVDLLAAQSRAPLRLRRAIARADTVDDLADLATALLPTVITAHESGRYPERVTATYSVLVESIVERLLNLALRQRDEPPARFAFVITGSLARHEMVPSSDVDSLMVWDGPDGDERIRSWMRNLASELLAGLARCGIQGDLNGVRADDPRFSRSLDNWTAAILGWAREPADQQADIYLAALADARAIGGRDTWEPLRDQINDLLQEPQVRAVMGRVAEGHRVPTGFARGWTIHASGERHATLDLKASGIGPIVDIARYLAVSCGSVAPSTLGRLQDAQDSGLSTQEDLNDLRDAFLLLTRVRLDHQSAQSRGGRAPDNALELADTPGPSVRELRDALRAVARAQRNLRSGLMGRRW